MSKVRILIPDGLHPNGVEALIKYGEVDDRNGIDSQELCAIIADYDALIIRGRTIIDAALLDKATRLKVIGRAGVGIDNIDLSSCKLRGVKVVNTPTAATLSVAELTVGLMMTLARPIIYGNETIKQGDWLKKELVGIELFGKTVGIIGLGRIGSQVAKILQVFGVDMIGFDIRPLTKKVKRMNVKEVTLDDIYRLSDFISIHVPLYESTREMINEASFQQMKNGVRIVCTSRGGIIDEAALLKALDSGKVSSAALDVFSKEPPGNTPLTTHPRVVATPHIGAQTEEAQIRSAVEVAGEVIAALNGEALRWEVY